MAVAVSAQSRNSYVISAALHGAVAAVLIFSAYEFSQQSHETSKVIELVAGDGNNWGATVAPAKGSPGGSDGTVPNFNRQLKNTIRRAEANGRLKAEKEFVAQQKAAEAAEKQNQKVRYEDWVKEHPGQTPPKNLPSNYKPVDTKGIAGGVEGGATSNDKGGARGKALVSEGGTEMERYFALLKNALRDNHEVPTGVSDRLSVRVEFFLAANGTISRVRIIRGSGNAEFDRSVREAFAQTQSIGARPDGKGAMHELEFKVRED